MNGQVKAIINSLGGLSEMLGVYRDMLIEQHFTREEAIQMCGAYVAFVLSKGKTEDSQCD
ncbi:hypothetical protein FACS18949_11910 [Clostridia bacterium]|nr:hypothetical protein FACS18949_11910 [Clostridia bacterium]